MGSLATEQSASEQKVELAPLGDAARRVDQALADLAARCMANGAPAIRNAVVRVELPDRGFVHASALGKALANSDAPMTPDHQYHLASVAKTMTSTLLLQLWERGALGSHGLETTLGETGLFDKAVLDRLHVWNGVSYGARITLRHLLTHTSGMKDAAVDDANGIAPDYAEGVAPGSYGARIRRHSAEHLARMRERGANLAGLITTKSWVPWDPARPYDQEAGVLNWYLNAGLGAAPLSVPGQHFHYSDTGFVILGLLTERLSGKSLHRQWRDHIFDPLGMSRTYLAYATDPDPGPWQGLVSDPYIGDVPLVSAGFNLSYDWAGGGVVSTARDTSIFLQALTHGKLFQRPETLREMLSFTCYPGVEAPRAGVGLGIFSEGTLMGNVVWGHSGAWGAKMYYEPDTGVFLAGTVNQRVGVPRTWWTDILRAMRA